MTSKAAVPTNSEGVDPCAERAREGRTKSRQFEALERSKENEREVSTHRRVVQNRPDISILNLIERIDALDSVVEQLVVDETDPSSSRQLVEVEIVGSSVDDASELRAELGDDLEDDVGLERSETRDEKGGELGQRKGRGRREKERTPFPAPMAPPRDASSVWYRCS